MDVFKKVNEMLNNNEKIAEEIIENLKSQEFGSLKDLVISLIASGDIEEIKQVYGDKFAEYWSKIMSLDKGTKKEVVGRIVNAL